MGSQQTQKARATGSSPLVASNKFSDKENLLDTQASVKRRDKRRSERI